MSERSPPDLSEAPIREIVPHTTGNGTPRDTSRENDYNTNKQYAGSQFESKREY